MSAERLSRRRVIVRFGGALLGVGLATACAPISTPAEKPPAKPATGNAAAPSPSPAAAGASAAPAAAKRGGTFIYGQTFAIQNTAPYPRSGNSGAFRANLFNTLVNSDERRQPVPELAESWSLSDDRLKLTLKLRQDVKFHSGRELTAEDAKWNVEYAQKPESKAQVGGQLRGVTAAATGKHTLELTFPGPTPQIFSLFVDLPIIDPQSNVETAVGGTGPFKLDALKPGDELRMVRNEQYWRRDRPLLDTAIVKIVPDPASLLVNLESGAVHAVATVPLNEMKRVQAGADTVGLVVPGPGNYNFLVSAVDEPFDDKRVRQAMGLAMDRQRFVETLMFGLTEPTYIVWPKSSPVWDASLDTGEFSLDKAKALLVEAGFPNGFETKIHATRGAIPEVAQFAQIFQADLAKIGVKASIEEVEANQWLSLITESKFPALLGHSYGAADQDPALLFSAHPFGTEKNASRFQSDEYKRLVTAAQAEADWEKRIGLYRDVTRLIKDEAFILPLANRVETRALRKNVQGFELDPQAHPKFENVSLA